MVNAAIKECKSPIKSVNRGNDLDTPIPKRKKFWFQVLKQYFCLSLQLGVNKFIYIVLFFILKTVFK